MNAEECRRRFGSVVVARMATVTAAGVPHLVPITFALLPDDTVITAVDHKRKRTTRLKRLTNIAANPAVALLADEYDEDWSRLWWVRADGHARVAAKPDQASLEALARRYPQYRQHPPQGPLIVIEIESFSGWSMTAREP